MLFNIKSDTDSLPRTWTLLMGQLNGVALAVDRGYCKLNGQGGQGENQDPHGRSGLPLGPRHPRTATGPLSFLSFLSFADAQSSHRQSFLASHGPPWSILTSSAMTRMARGRRMTSLRNTLCGATHPSVSPSPMVLRSRLRPRPPPPPLRPTLRA